MEEGAMARAGVFMERLWPLWRWHYSQSSSEEDSEKSLSPCSEAVLGVVGARGWSSATTPAWPFSTAKLSGVWPSSSGLLGLTSSRLRSIFTTPSCPFSAAILSGVCPYSSGLSGLTSPRPSSI